MRKKPTFVIIVIIILAVLGLFAAFPGGFKLPYFKNLSIHQGLDLKGGTRIVYELDTSNLKGKTESEAQSAVVDVLERRVNVLGVSEPYLAPTKFSGKYGVIVELPGVTDINEAVNILGKTAELKFQEQDEKGNPKDTGLTGAHLKKSQVQFDQNSNEPQVGLEFDTEGAKMFGEITDRNLQKPVAILLDNEVISAPTVQSKITDGKAIITGQFTIKEARQLSDLLNAGALPVPIKIAGQENIAATLGTQSVQQSLLAGILGIILVTLFMLLYYRGFGAVAVAALFIYTILVFAIFKIIPVTLTLAGITGFILSIGMAVDANILIFERTREELRTGKQLISAVEEGFKRAWPSIRDSNISSLITATILFYGTTGLVRGFAVTLAIGILVSMFSAITVSRIFIRMIVK